MFFYATFPSAIAKKTQSLLASKKQANDYLIGTMTVLFLPDGKLASEMAFRLPHTEDGRRVLKDGYINLFLTAGIDSLCLTWFVRSASFCRLHDPSAWLSSCTGTELI